MIMVKLPKSIIAKYGITKKAWQVFRGKKGTASKPAKKHKRPRHKRAHKRARKVTGETQERGVVMAKRRKRSVRHRVRRASRRIKTSMETRPGKIVMAAGETAMGGIISSLAVNKLPLISGQSRMVKGTVQGAFGLGAIMFIRNRHAKALGAGSLVVGLLSIAKDLFKVDPLAGPSMGSRTLTPSEMQRLTNGQMSMPLPGARMGVPLSTAPANAGFGRGGFGS
jgi:hypothetical protein